MKLVPHNNYIVCKQISEEAEKTLTGGIVINQQDPMIQYEVVNPGSSKFQIGDVVVANSIPTKVCSEKQQYVMICVDNIIGVVK